MPWMKYKLSCKINNWCLMFLKTGIGPCFYRFLMARPWIFVNVRNTRKLWHRAEKAWVLQGRSFVEPSEQHVDITMRAACSIILSTCRLCFHKTNLLALQQAMAEYREFLPAMTVLRCFHVSCCCLFPELIADWFKNWRAFSLGDFGVITHNPKWKRGKM